MSKSKFLSLLYSLGTRFYIVVVGQLMIAEILAFISLPLINFQKLFANNKDLKIVVISLVYFLIFQVFSDVINESDSVDYLRGWAVILFAIISTIFLTKQFSTNKYSIIYYLLGIFLVRLFFGEGELNLSIQEENSNYFKVRFVGFISPGVIITSFILFTRNFKRSAILLFLGYSLVCFSLDARSTGIIFLISFIFLYIKYLGIYLTRFRLLGYGFFISISLFLGYIYYVGLVLNSDFGGSNAQNQLNAASNPYNPFELLYSGRKEVFVSFYAIADKPILGHGSWAKDLDGKYGRLLVSLSTNSQYDKDFIPSHSIIFSSWLYAGVFGVLSLGYVFFILFRSVLFHYKYRIFDSYTLILIVISFEMLWHMFFSPFGLLRVSFPFFASLVISYSNKNLI
jgi:hypothetical protein